ncbi:hypothetical protein Syun_007208 [Stephania yunnanensis]|uniref:Reverse transcriptase domain-containing protein n=1 Tax=Stephania yunnanensis TaxID=152371 RepID=A0AAP0PYB4_9MAGN
MKVVANRFKEVLSTLARPEQTSFVAGRHITNNITVAQELILSRRSVKGRKGWMALKLDLEKACDRLSWRFIEDTLKDAQVPTILCQTIMRGLLPVLLKYCGMRLKNIKWSAFQISWRSSALTLDIEIIGSI